MTDGRTDGQTDGQTDGRAIAYSALSMLSRANKMLTRAARVLQVLHDLFYVLLQLLVVAAIILSFKFYRKFYCKFYCTCEDIIHRHASHSDMVAAMVLFGLTILDITVQMLNALISACSQGLPRPLSTTIKEYYFFKRDNFYRLQGAVFK